MPRPTCDVNGPAYQALLHKRHLHHLYGSAYEDVLWAEETLKRLETQPQYIGYSEQDRADFYKAKAIYARVHAKRQTQRGETADAHTTTHYIWRTQGDASVRPEHAANEGRIFSWDAPPPTGNPGEDFGCRCWAEPYRAELQQPKEYSTQTVTFVTPNLSPPWQGVDFAEHYFFGNGKPITLFQIGHLKTIIDAAKTLDQPELGGGTLFQRVSSDIRQKARLHATGSFPYDFKNTYNFKDFVYSIGGATVSGVGQIDVEDTGNHLLISGNIQYRFHDVFTDVFSIKDATKAIDKALNRHRKPDDNPDKIGAWDLPGSTPYLITDTWSTHIEAFIKKDSSSSRFPNMEPK